MNFFWSKTERPHEIWQKISMEMEALNFPDQISEALWCSIEAIVKNPSTKIPDEMRGTYLYAMTGYAELFEEEFRREFKKFLSMVADEINDSVQYQWQDLLNSGMADD